MDPFTIGIDLGGTNLRIAAYSPNATGHRQADGSNGVSASRKFLSRIDLPTRVGDGPQSVMREIAEQVHILTERHSGHILAGIGLGTPGPLELPAGILHAPPNLPGWDGFELRAELESMLDQSVHVESDANLAALAEFAVGAGAADSSDSLCMLTLGTGVGNAIILSGAVWNGTHGMAGEAGHTAVWPDGLPCNCGNRGCLELYASATGVRRMAEEAIQSSSAPGLKAWRDSGGILDAHAINHLATQGDPDALRIFSAVGTALGIALGSLVNTLDLRLYVIGGGLAGAWDLFCPAMFRELDTRSYVYRLANERLPRHRIQVVRAVLGSDSGLLGAAILPLGPRNSAT